ncbi:serine hydrolase domain-containing protein [Robertkochia flava]|uniref:serine hydrolase domain-containing protein n=1 Tax=Robertkochia flava TaxID=3447986 RepID=UPI001CCDB1EF|nr:serine hydrolase [Robertkochia marina]
MTKFIWSITLFCFPIILQAQEMQPQIEQEILRRVDQHINPSVAIGIITREGDKKFYNYGSYTASGINTPDSTTLYEIGSVTKTFTSALTERYLADQTKASLDMFFQKVAKENSALKHISLAELRNHRSGLPRLSAQFSPHQWSDPFKGYTDEKLYEELRQVDPDTAKGWAYSNFGYGVLGKVIEKQTEKDFGVLVSGLALEAGMQNTWPGHAAAIDSVMAVPTNIGTTNSFWHFEGPSRYAGGLISSTNDLLKYLEFQVKTNPLFGQRDIENTVETGIHNLGRDMLFYKDGWFVFTPEPGTEILLHNGGTGGYTSFVGYNKKTQTGVVALSNSVSLLDDIALKLIYPPFQLKAPRRSIAYDLAMNIEENDAGNLVQNYEALKAEDRYNNIIDIYWLERYHFGEGHYEISNQLSDILLLELPDDWEVVDIKGQNLEKLQRYGEAQKMYEAALKLNPDNKLLREKALRMIEIQAKQ